MRKLTLLLVVQLLMVSWVFAQAQTVTGKVIDEKGAAIAGASVLEKGTAKGTSTKTDGTFSLKLKQGALLIIQGVGLETQTVKASEGLIVTLKSSTANLDEVIVSGVAASTSRKNLSVSVTKLTSEQLSATPALDPISALSGKVAGITVSSSSGQPGKTLDLQLRADNNLTNVGSGPMIVVDGVILNGNLSDINADDIESIEVVKGASAGALYGSRAGNGVIVVATKRGAGLAPNTTNIVVRNEVGFQNIGHKIGLATHHYDSLATDWQNYKGIYTKYAGVTYPTGYTDAGYNPAISGSPIVKADGYMDNPYGVNHDQQNEFFGTGTNLTNFIGISSKSAKTNVYFSFENNDQKGVINFGTGYKRQNYRLNIDHQIAPWLKISATNLFISTTTDYPGASEAAHYTTTGGNSGDASSAFFNVVLTTPDVNLNALNPDGQPYYLRSDQWHQTTTNPLYALWRYNVGDNDRRWIGNYSANIKFTTWANLDVSQSVEIENYRYSNSRPKNTWHVDASGTTANDLMSYTNGSLYKYSSEKNSYNTQATLNLGKKFGDLDVRGKLSFLYENKNFDDNSTTALQYVYTGIPNFNNFNSISSATSSTTEEKAQNYFAALSLNWKNKYLLDGMYRYDGSSLFGPNNRWNSYYRVSGAYRITQDFKIPGIDEMKIRAAYGTAGIRPSYDWQYEYYTLNAGVATATQKGNRNLKPSQTAEAEIGLNVEFLKKFSFEAVYAKSKTTDQFLNVSLLPFLNDGFSSQYQNAGTVESNTFELTLGAKWVKRKDFSWTSNFTFTKMNQKITSLPIAPYLYGPADGAAAVFYAKQGETYGSMYGNRFVRTLAEMSNQLPSGSTISNYEVNSDGYVVLAGSQGKLTEAPIKLNNADGTTWYGKIGDGVPDFRMGIANTFTYKQFSLYFLVDIKSGGSVYNVKAQYLTRDDRNIIEDMYGKPASAKKTYKYFQVFYDAGGVNNYWVENASYIKLRELSLGYNLDTRNIAFLRNTIKGIIFKVVGRNLATFTKYSGYDPEVGSIRTPYDGAGQYPNFRNMALSLSLNF